jgi:membrane-associated phospholipid phosphatase
MKKLLGTCLMFAVVTLAAPPAQADEVTDWNQIMLRAGLVAGTSPTTMMRVAAMVQVAVFDAVNGIGPRYEHFLVDPAGAPARASKRAAAVQAAYAMLTKLYGSGAPTPNAAQQANFEARRTVSLGEIAKHEGNSAINAGITWGQSVANAVFDSRIDDGFSQSAPFTGSTAIGQWRQTPNLPVSPALSPAGLGYLQVSQQTPWVMTTFSSFRPGLPPALTSAQYAKDFNEVKVMGSQLSALRTTDQTTFSLFWASGTVSYLWNTVALSLIENRERDRDRDEHDWDRRWNHGKRNTLLENARLLGVLDVAMADASIGCWDAKYTYTYWRPITAIRELGDDGNAATSPDPNWVPLIATPGHPEYPSGHSCASGAAATVLSDEFGERTRFTVESDLLLGVTRSFKSFTEALQEVANARIFSGIHFRTACEVGQGLGRTIARYVRESRFQPLD